MKCWRYQNGISGGICWSNTDFSGYCGTVCLWNISVRRKPHVSGVALCSFYNKIGQLSNGILLITMVPRKNLLTMSKVLSATPSFFGVFQNEDGFPMRIFRKLIYNQRLLQGIPWLTLCLRSERLFRKHHSFRGI